MEAARVSVTESDLVAALRAASEADAAPLEGVFTSQDVRRALSCGDDMARRRIREMIAAGRASPVKVQVSDISGRRLRVPAYQLAS